jgi:uncharacterized protein (TIGR03084 family)
MTGTGMPKVTIAELLSDLAAEHAALDAVVADLDDEGWTTPTPATGWDVGDCISHLCYFDESATLALTDPDGFESHKTELIAAMTKGEHLDVALGRASGPPGAIVSRWRAGRGAFLDAAGVAAASGTPPRVPWYGPPMSLASFTTARLMETWAHGQDVRDALGRPPEVSLRLRHIIHIGVGARPYSFAVHEIDDPGDAVTVTATAPDGQLWTWGPHDPAADNQITGSALDLALVLTQRRHVSHTGVVVTGPVAQLWLDIAQAFAGPPTVTSSER